MGDGLKSFVTSFLLYFHGPAGYVGVFTLLVACGLGLPLPEDIALITGGFLAAMGPQHGGVGSVWVMMAVGLVGILVGDSIIFKAGKDYGDALLHTRLGKHIPQARIERVRALFAKHGSKLIMLARFLPGLRAVTYFVAGTSRVSYLVFLTYDGVAALISAPVWVWLGYKMGRNHMIRRAFAMAKQFEMAIFAILAVAAVGCLVWWGISRRRAAQRRAQLHANMDKYASEHDIGSGSSSKMSSLNGKSISPRPGIERA